jgi:hypothetical protein
LTHSRLALAAALAFSISLPAMAQEVDARASYILTLGGINIASGTESGALRKEQSLFNPDPLFLPTAFNASQPRLPSLVRREPGASFQPMSAKYTYTVAEAQIRFADPVIVPARIVDALDYGGVQNPYEVFGRFSRDEPALPARQAIIEVVQTRTGRIVLSVPVNEPDAPSMLASADWRPLELLASVDVTGLTGAPVLARGSGVEVIDTFFRSYLAKEFRIGDRLPPGFYALRVGP